MRMIGPQGAIKATGDRVIAAPIEMSEIVKEEMHVLHLPDTFAGTMGRELEFRLGRVISVGPGMRMDTGEYREVPVSVGETVVWRKFDGVETEFEGEKIQILNTDQLLAVLDV